MPFWQRAGFFIYVIVVMVLVFVGVATLRDLLSLDAASLVFVFVICGAPLVGAYLESVRREANEQGRRDLANQQEFMSRLASEQQAEAARVAKIRTTHWKPPDARNVGGGTEPPEPARDPLG